jgi:hypothetical protein
MKTMNRTTSTLAVGDHTILVMDVSASMLADEAGPSRMELARREAQSRFDGPVVIARPGLRGEI